MDPLTLGFAPLAALLPQIPVFLVWLVGIALAVAYWRRHPRVSLWVVIALVLFSCQAIAGTVTSTMLPLTLYDQGFEPDQIGYILGAFGFGSALVAAVGWGLILAAVFTGRPESMPE